MRGVRRLGRRGGMTGDMTVDWESSMVWREPKRAGNLETEPSSEKDGKIRIHARSEKSHPKQEVMLLVERKCLIRERRKETGHASDRKLRLLNGFNSKKDTYFHVEVNISTSSWKEHSTKCFLKGKH